MTGQGKAANLQGLLAAGLDWWREAGIEHDLLDEAQDWLAPARERAAAQEPPPAPEAASRQPRESVAPRPQIRIGGERARWPQTLEDFAGWWLTDPALDDAPAARRVPPAGRGGAALMVLVAMPEAEDQKALLSGPQGRLLDAMLGAMGLSRETAYLASALPSRIAAPDWRALGSAGLGEVVAHHVALAAPQKLLVLGRSDISPLLGHDPAKSAPFEPKINHEGQRVAAFADYGLEAMLARPALKAGFWGRWLEWTSGQ